MPARQTDGSAGYDVAAAAEVLLEPGDRKLVPTGFAIALPHGWECQIRPRSGLAFKHGVTLPNTPATIDSDYRGELMVALVNLGREAYVVARGMRIAQLIFARVSEAEFLLTSELPGSGRGAGGFGSTGA